MSHQDTMFYIIIQPPRSEILEYYKLRGVFDPKEDSDLEDEIMDDPSVGEEFDTEQEWNQWGID